MDNLRAKGTATSGNNNKITGSIYEHKFVVDAMLRGLFPHAPPCDMPCHDFIVQNSKGKSLVTQVRSTATLQPRKRGEASNRFKVATTCHNKQTTLNASPVDVLSIYVVPYDTWYHIPSYKLKSKMINLYPHLIESKGTWEKYKGAWEVFEK